MTEGSWRTKLDATKVDRLLDDFRESDNFTRLFHPEYEGTCWEPEPHRLGDSEEDRHILDHIRSLRFPRFSARYSERPAMILYGLGTFSNEPTLRARVEELFSGNHTFLLNTSGSGKTRLLYEGLVQNWGLFFTATGDEFGLGTSDLHSILVYDLEHEPQFTYPLSRDFPENELKERLDRNIQLSERHFSIVLLARLLVFNTFLDAWNQYGRNPAHRELWLKLQLSFPFQDLEVDFHTLVQELLRSDLGQSQIDEAISQTLDDIFAIEDLTQEGPVFIALDEANFASKTLKPAYVDEDGEHYPVLKVILRTWVRQLKDRPFVFLVSGVEIPKDQFQGDEWQDWVWSSGTGAFDDQESQRNYALNFIPPNLRESDDVRRLLDRMWKWLRGRHRCTAAFISVLLERCFRDSNLLLDSYVWALTGGYWPHDDNDDPRPAETMPFSTVDFRALGYNKRVASCMHASLISSVLRIEDVPVFTDPAVIKVVNLGLGRFRDRMCTEIVIDEPVMIAGGANWFVGPDREESFLDTERFCRNVLEDTTPDFHAAQYLCLCIAAAFDSRRPYLDEVFNFSKEMKQQSHQQAEIVFWEVAEEESSEVVLRYTEMINRKLVRIASTENDVIAWLRNRDFPFCISTLKRDTAILMFILKIGDEERFWVFLRMMPPSQKGRLTTNLVTDFAASIDPSNIFSKKSLPKARKALKALPGLVGQSGLLRVVGSFHQSLKTAPSSSGDASSIAILEMAPLLEPTKQCVSEEMVTALMEFATNNDDMKRKHSQVTDEEADADEAPPKRVLRSSSRGTRGTRRTTRGGVQRKGKGAASSTRTTDTSRGTSVAMTTLTRLRRSRRLAR
ncbi:hypothetical protein VNI00_003720 [Paramarasmius palmivorus]|uniref:Uncharacterized protein n=1 Tax=Paramarasmius palmivorus TaxID=297713 RepID=A0AAW0DUE1_9AGAR